MISAAILISSVVLWEKSCRQYINKGARLYLNKLYLQKWIVWPRGTSLGYNYHSSSRDRMGDKTTGREVDNELKRKGIGKIINMDH